MISTVRAKSFHIHILHYLILKPGEIDKTGGIILIFQIKKTEVSNSLTDLPKIIQQVVEPCLKLRVSRFQPGSLYHFCISFLSMWSIGYHNISEGRISFI